MALAILGNDCLSFCISQVLYALLGFKMELNPESLVFSIDQAEGMATEAVHMAVRVRNTSVAHNDSHLVQRFWEIGEEIPLVTSTAHISTRVSFNSVI